MDIKSPEARSRNMSKIKSAKTKPEMFIRSLLFREGMRFRVNYSAVKGKPDLYFSKSRVALFIHGCYWHRHENCQYAYTPKSNVDFWLKKLEGNREHDRKIIAELNSQNIRVLIVWECAVKKAYKTTADAAKLVSVVRDFIYNNDNLFMEV